MVRGERERRFNRRLTRLCQRVHIPYPSKRLYAPHLFPHPQTSRRIICACSGLVGTTANRMTWLTKKIADLSIADCELRIADISHRATETQRRSTQDGFYLSVLFSVSLCLCGSVANIRNSLRLAYPYVRAVVGNQAESIRRRADTYVGMRESPRASSTNKKTVRISRLPQG